MKLSLGEQVICEARVSRVAYVFSFLWLILLLAVGGFSGLITTKFVVTNKRVRGTRGAIRRKTIDVALAEISTVRVQRGLTGKIFDYGTLTVMTRAGDQHVFKGISAPLYVKQEIEEAIEVSVLGHKLSDYVGDTGGV